MYFSEFVDVCYRADREISARTFRDYYSAARCFERWAKRRLPLEELSPNLLNRYLLSLSESGKSPVTVHGRRNRLLILWRAAAELDYTPNWPDERKVRRVKLPEPNPRCWSLDEERRVVAYAEVHMRYELRSVKVPAGDYVAALVRFLHDSGMRIGDALSMEFDWIAGGTVTWMQSKTGHWHRAKLSQKTMAAIAKIRTDNRRLIWPRRRSDSGAVYSLIREAAKGAGVKGTSKYIRRAVATDAYQRGLDPARALGHVPGSRVAIKWYVPQDVKIEPISPTEL